MKKAIFSRICFFTVILLVINSIGCTSTTKNTTTGTTSILEGSWENKAFKLLVKENTYISIFNDYLYGAGSITFDGKHLIMLSSYAWANDHWNSYVEAIEGDCVINGDNIIISNVKGRYSDFNGTWKKIEDIDLNSDKYKNRPPASSQLTDISINQINYPFFNLQLFDNQNIYADIFSIKYNSMFFNNIFFDRVIANTNNYNTPVVKITEKNKNDWLGFFTVAAGYAVIWTEFYNNPNTQRRLTDEWNRRIEEDKLYQRIMNNYR